MLIRRFAVQQYGRLLQTGLPNLWPFSKKGSVKTASFIQSKRTLMSSPCFPSSERSFHEVILEAKNMRRLTTGVTTTVGTNVYPIEEKFLETMRYHYYDVIIDPSGISGGVVESANAAAFILRKRTNLPWLFDRNHKKLVYMSSEEPLLEAEVMAIIDSYTEGNSGTAGLLQLVENIRFYEQRPGIEVLPCPNAKAMLTAIFIEQLPGWKDHVTQVLVRKREEQIDLTVARYAALQGIVDCRNQPGIVFGMYSKIFFRKSLQEFIKERGSVTFDLEGLQVGCWDIDWLSGEIAGKPVTMTEQSIKQGLKQTTTPALQRAWQMSKKGEDFAVLVRSRGKNTPYTFPARALFISISSRNSVFFERNQVPYGHLQSKLKISAGSRYRLTEKLAEYVSRRKIVREFPLNSSWDNDCFGCVDLSKQYLVYGNGTKVSADNPWGRRNKAVQMGIYDRGSDKPFNLKLSILYLCQRLEEGGLERYAMPMAKSFAKELERYEGDIESVEIVDSQVISFGEDATWTKFHIDMNNYVKNAKEKGRFVIAISTFAKGVTDVWTLFNTVANNTKAKTLFVMESLSTRLNSRILQVLSHKLLSELGKTMVTLHPSLPYVTKVVGLDVHRDQKENGRGTTNMAAYIQFSNADGTLIDSDVSRIQSMEGETISHKFLVESFRQGQVKKGDVLLIQRDGFFQSGEEDALREAAEVLGAVVKLTESIKKTYVRLFEFQKAGPVNARVNNYLILKNGIYLQASSPNMSATALPVLYRRRENSKWKEGETGIEIKELAHAGATLRLLHPYSPIHSKVSELIRLADAMAYKAHETS